MIKDKNAKKTASPTMDSLLKKYSQSQKATSRGDRVKGKVVQKLPRKLIVDIGGKSEAIVAEKAYEQAKGFIDNLEIGDEVEGVVLIPENNEGNTVLSLRQAAVGASWDKLEKVKNEGKEIRVFGISSNPSGVIVEVGGLHGFIPNSQLGKNALQNKEKLIGKEFSSIIIEIEAKSNRLILSEKASSEGITPDLVKKAGLIVKEADTYEGVVTTT